MITTLLSIASIIFGIFLIVKKLTAKKLDENIDYPQKGNVTSQEKYNSIKNPNKSSLSLNDIIDLSWRFLYNLSETILNKFSAKHQKEVIVQGRVMVKNGMKYQHVVDVNPKVVESYAEKVMAQMPTPNELQR